MTAKIFRFPVKERIEDPKTAVDLATAPFEGDKDFKKKFLAALEDGLDTQNVFNSVEEYRDALAESLADFDN